MSCIFVDELGDYDPEDHKEGYLSEFRVVPKQVSTLICFTLRYTFALS